MRKIILSSIGIIFLMTLCIQQIKAQSIFIKTGRNLTNYTFNSTSLANLQNEIGQTLELGYTGYRPNNKRFYYGLSAGIEEYNASGIILGSNLVWETTYANVKGLAYYELLHNEKNGIAIKSGLGLATMMHGRQQIDGKRYDLLKQDEFKGVFISPQIGLSYHMTINRMVSLCLDYDYAHQFSLTNTTDQKLQFINHSLSVGFSIDLN